MEQTIGRVTPHTLPINPDNPSLLKTRTRTAKNKVRAWTCATSEEPGLAFWLMEVAEAFFTFGKKTRKLEHLVRKMRSPISSEGYNYLLERQVDEVRCTFAAYLKAREDMLAYIKSHYWRSRFYGRPQQCFVENETEETIGELVVRAS